MKNTRKKLLTKLSAAMLCLVLSFALSVAAFAEEEAAQEKVGSVTAFTEGLSVNSENNMAVTVTNTEAITLDFAPIDESIGRNQKGWWAGIKVTADSTIEKTELEKVQLRKSSDAETDISFWACKDSAEDAQEHFVILWVPVTADEINSGVQTVTRSYVFDWDNNGFEDDDQIVTVELDLSKIEFTHLSGHNQEEKIPAKEASCKDSGYTAEIHCAECGLILQKSTATDPLGHDWKAVKGEEYFCAESTCVVYDTYFYSCSRCDVLSEEVFEDKEGSTLKEHTEIKKLDEKHLISPADCTNPAKYFMGCATCDTVFDEIFYDGTPIYHSWKIEKVTKKASLTADGAINFFCDDCGEMDNQPIPIPKIASVALSATKFAYNGKAITPEVTIKDRAGTPLVKDRDYTVKYVNYNVPGTATAQITFIGRYEGSYDAKYTIDIPSTPKADFLSNTGTIRITWEKVPSVAGYGIYYKTATGWKAYKSTTATSLTITGLPSGTRYTFAIRSAVNISGKIYWASGYTTIDTVTTSPAPAKIVAIQNTSAIRITWSAVKGADGYAVYYSTQAGWKLVGLTTATSATFQNLPSGTNYILAVKSVDLTASGEKIGGTGYTQIITATKPVSPVVSVTTQGGAVSVRWTAVKGASGYQVYYKSTTSGGYVLLKTVGSGTTSFTDSGYTVGSPYAFAVRAVKAVQGGYIYGPHEQVIITMK